MTQIINNNSTTIDYSDDWLDNFEPYIYEDYDFRQEDRNGYIIQIPSFQTYEKKDFSGWFNDNFLSDSTFNAQDDIIKMQIRNEEYKKFKNKYTKKDSPSVLWNKQAGKFIAYGMKKDGSGYEPLGSPSTNAGALVSRIDKKHKDRLEIKDPVSGIRFDNQAQFDEYKLEEEEKLTIKRYGDFSDTYLKFHNKDGKIKDIDLDKALITKTKWMDAYIQNNRSDNPYGNPVDTPQAQEQGIKAFKELKVIELIEYPERLGSLVNWTFGNEENTNPLEDGYPMTVHHPVKIEVLQTVMDEMVKHSKDRNPNVKMVIDKANEYIKKQSTDHVQIISAKLDEAIRENEDKNAFTTVTDFMFKDLLPSIMSAEYVGGDRDARNNVWYGAENVIKSLTHNKKGDRMQYTVNGRGTNQVRQAIDNNQEWLEPIISNPYAFENNSNHFAFKDLVMMPLFEDLISEYKHENKIYKERYKPQDFMMWLYQHPDKKYSSVDDDSFYSYYELIKIGYNKNKDNIYNEEVNKIMSIDVNELGQYNTTKAVRDEYETYKKQRIHPKSDKPNYNGMELWKQMIHEKPELLISFLQQSKKTRGDNFFPFDRSQGTWNQSTEEQVIRELQDAFGFYDKSGEFIDWYTIKPFDFPNPGDIQESYVDSLFFNNPNYK